MGKGNKKGRPPPQWLSLTKTRKKEISATEIMELYGIDRATVSRVMAKHKVDWRGGVINGKFVKLYCVAAAKKTYLAAVDNYYSAK